MLGFGGGGWGPDSTRGLDKHPGALRTFLRITKRLPKHETFESDRADEAPFTGATDESIDAFVSSRSYQREDHAKPAGFFRRLLQRFR